MNKSIKIARLRYYACVLISKAKGRVGLVPARVRDNTCSCYRMQFKILFVAIVAGICSCQECTLPTSGDLEDVIADIIEADDSSSTPNVNVMSFHPVCLALDDVQDRYRTVSVLVEYRCTGNPSCPSGTVVEQIESECDNGDWSYLVQGSPEFTRSQTSEASFLTSTREDCAFCVSPELDVEAGLSLSPDSVTHCVGEYVTRHKCTISHSTGSYHSCVYFHSL